MNLWVALLDHAPAGQWAVGTGANSHNMHSNACQIRKQMEKIESSLKYDHLSCPARDFKHSSLWVKSKDTMTIQTKAIALNFIPSILLAMLNNKNWADVIS